MPETSFPKRLPCLIIRNSGAFFLSMSVRRTVRACGFAGLAFSPLSLLRIALLSVATESLWHDVKYQNVITVVFELCGLGGAIIAGGSLWLGPWRQEWLESRFMTERLRQWHFQLLVRRGQEIEALLAGPTGEALQNFQAQRKKWFDDFLHEHEGKIDSRMDSLANDPEFSGEWLFPTL